MRIPINDLKRRCEPLAAELAGAVNRVLASGWYILGPEVEGFEAEFARYCGAGNCVGVGNGTDALELALRAVGVAPGAEVAAVANAGMYATTAILRAEARPLFVDVDARSMTMSAAALGAAISRETAAVVVTHLYGRMGEMEALLEVAGRSGLPVIEDCAQAHGASRAGRKSGTWGTLGCFSFYPTKNLGALGDGGAVVTSDAGLAAKVRALRQYGWTGRYCSTVAGGRNSRLDEMQAAVLRVMLPRLDGWNARRREIARMYGEALGLPARAAGDAVHLYVIRVRNRERVRRELAAAGIGSDVHYPVPDHWQESVRGQMARQTELPLTEALAAEVLTLPGFPEMTDGEVREVAGAVSAVLEEAGDGEFPVR